MFLKKSTASEIASSMEESMVEAAYEDTNRTDIKRAEAAEYLSVAASAFKQAGKHKYAKVANALTQIILNSNEFEDPRKGKTPKNEEYYKTHEGPDEAKREKQERRESLEDQFLDSVLGEDEPEINEADDYDSLFEDV